MKWGQGWDVFNCLFFQAETFGFFWDHFWSKGMVASYLNNWAVLRISGGLAGLVGPTPRVGRLQSGRKGRPHPRMVTPGVRTGPSLTITPYQMTQKCRRNVIDPFNSLPTPTANKKHLRCCCFLKKRAKFS